MSNWSSRYDRLLAGKLKMMHLQVRTRGLKNIFAARTHPALTSACETCMGSEDREACSSQTIAK